MPIETISYKNVLYQIVTANKAHEPSYRTKLSAIIRDKYGEKIERAEISSALQDSFDFYVDEMHKITTQIVEANFFIFIYFLHEETSKISYETRDNYDFPIDYQYFSLYRRILKMILQESCFLNLQTTDPPDKKWIDSNVFIIEKLVYLGHFLIGQVESISEEKITKGSVDIVYENGLITFVNSEKWEDFIPMLTKDFPLDLRNSIIDINLRADFDKRIKTQLGLDISDIEIILAALNNELHNLDPPQLCTLEAFLDIVKSKSSSLEIDNFIRGLILNKDNVASLKSSAYSPYKGDRIIHKPILTLTIDGTECILVDQFSFSEAMNTFFQNNITLGKIPAEWEPVEFLKKIRNDYKDHNKNILENPVEEKLKELNLNYVRNVKTLYANNKQHLSINKTPGEIDYIFIIGNTVYIADCKNLTKRYEMHGYYQDISKFISQYNPTMRKKLDFFNSNILKLQEHLQIEFKNSNLDLSTFTIEGIFIINTPTIYMLNGEYKIYTFHRFCELLEGDDFFIKYLACFDGDRFSKITWPFIDSYKSFINTI